MATTTSTIYPNSRGSHSQLESSTTKAFQQDQEDLVPLLHSEVTAPLSNINPQQNPRREPFQFEIPKKEYSQKRRVKHRFYPTWAVRLQRDEHMMDKYTPTCRRWKRNPRAGSQLLLSLPSKLSRHTARLRAILVHGILRLLLLGIVQHKAGDQLFEERSGSSFNSTA